MTDDATHEITNLLNFYALVLDTAQWPLFDHVFTANVKVDYGPTMNWQDLASFKRDFGGFFDTLDASQHIITNHQITRDGDRAAAITYGNWRLIRHVPEGGGDLWEGTGWYDDRLVRTPQGWRIADRICRVLWWTGNPRVCEAIPGSRYDPGLTSMRGEAATGRLRYLTAATRK